MAKCHERVAFAREDFQHKVSRQLIDENQAVVVETLKVKNMTKNHCLDKAKQSGKHVMAIVQWFASSKICSCCDYQMGMLALSVRQWPCPSGQHQHDRDIHVAYHIRDIGLAELLGVSGCIKRSPVATPISLGAAATGAQNTQHGSQEAPHYNLHQASLVARVEHELLLICLL